MKKFLIETHLLDYQHPKIKKLIAKRKWVDQTAFEKIRQIYHFVKNEIVFGYNPEDEIKASEVLEAGYGQCNTKATLLMALLRGVGIPARMHGFLIDKRMQKGALTGITYLLAPERINHTWAEAFYENHWIALEGVILDTDYYHAVKNKLQKWDDGYYGYAAAVSTLCEDEMNFKGQSTYCQSLAIVEDFGIFDSPDLFFRQHKNISSPMKQFIYGKYLSKRLNKRLDKIRNEK